MTEDLLAAVESADLARCVRALKWLSETERRTLYPAVAETLRRLDEASRRDLPANASSHWEKGLAARLAILGTATLSGIAKVQPWPFDDECVYAVLCDRRPAWLAEWAALELERNFWNWRCIRRLVREGLIAKPQSEFYILGMIAAPDRSMSVTEFLKSDPDLIKEEIWRLFEWEGRGELSLAAYDKVTRQPYRWAESFLSLATEGTIDRQRVLRCSLDALARDFAPFRAGWFSRLHEALQPTLTERVSLREKYLHLLNSRVPATVTFAMKALSDMEHQGAFDAALHLDRLVPVLNARSKGTVMRALAMLRRATTDCGEEQRVHIAAAAARALTHESADVQESALRLVRHYPSLVDPHLPLMAASVRARVQTSPETREFSQPAPSIALLRVVPLADAETVVEQFAAVLENLGPPADIERVLDGVARFEAPARLSASLASRARAMLRRNTLEQPRTLLASLALSWIEGHWTAAPPTATDIAVFLEHRVWRLAELVACKARVISLSLPTWADGRIDPDDLEQRMLARTPTEWQAIEADVSSLAHLDLLLARIRTGQFASLAMPKMRLSWQVRSWEVDGRVYSHSDPVLELDDPPGAGSFDVPRLSAVRSGSSLEMKRWCATVCPMWMEGWFAAGCRDLSNNLDFSSADWSTRAYLEPLLQPGIAIGPMGALLLAFGVAAKDPGEHTLAVDALGAAIRAGRINGETFGAAIVEAASSGAVKLHRWSRQLLRTSHLGPDIANAIFVALEIFLESGCKTGDPGYRGILELAKELTHVTGLRLTRPRAIQQLRALAVKRALKPVISDLLRP